MLRLHAVLTGLCVFLLCYGYRLWRGGAILIFVVSSVFGALPAQAHQAQDAGLLTAEQAFVFSARMVAEDIVQVNYQVAPGYYLYRERFAFLINPPDSATLGKIVFPPSEVKVDPIFKQTVQVYKHSLAICVPIHAGEQPVALVVTAQGCADRGICYPPVTATIHLQPTKKGYAIVHTYAEGKLALAQTLPVMLETLSASPANSSLDALRAGGKSEERLAFEAEYKLDKVSERGVGHASDKRPGGVVERRSEEALGPVAEHKSEEAPGCALKYRSDEKMAGGVAKHGPEEALGLTALADADDFSLVAAMQKMGSGHIVAVFLVLGILLSLTPCVLPMLPILAALVVGTRAKPLSSRWQGLRLALAYVLGVSMVYTTLGIIAGLSGAGLAAYLQATWIRILFALLLGILALAMFGSFTFQVPTTLQSRLTRWAGRFPGGVVSGAFLMGGVSALVIGPCVAPPLAGALLYISQTGDVALGAMALFALSWGMGVPLLVMGASVGHVLPKPGPWMNLIKQFFGMLLFGTAWWMLAVLLPENAQTLGWALLMMIGSVMLRAFEALPAHAGMRHKFAKGLGLWLVLIAVTLMIKLAVVVATMGDGSYGRSLLSLTLPKVDPASFKPPHNVAAKTKTELQFETVHSVAQFEARLARNTRPVLLDIYADWCEVCRQIEQSTFTDPAVKARLSDLLLLRVDVTANNAQDRAFLKHFQLFGPPAILFFDAQGVERTDIRMLGFQTPDRLIKALNQLIHG